MVQRRSNRGQIIDFDALIAQQGNQPAVGNMGVDAKGNRLGAGGRVIQSNEDRVREYYKDTKTISIETSVQGTPIKADVTQDPVTKPKTAKTAAENVRVAELDDQPSEFNEPEEVAPLEPLGFNEITLPNGDIDMVPYFNNEDKITKRKDKKK